MRHCLPRSQSLFFFLVAVSLSSLALSSSNDVCLNPGCANASPEPFPPTVVAPDEVGMAILREEALSFPFQTPDPFLFVAYHRDAYPRGNEKMEAPRKGNGSDFQSQQAYRMYHGDRIPGFPQHPHRGISFLDFSFFHLHFSLFWLHAHYQASKR